MIIKGIPSGDLECWCLLVSANTFEHVTGKPPRRTEDRGKFAKGEFKYALYPTHIIPVPDEKKGKPVTISISRGLSREEKLELALRECLGVMDTVVNAANTRESALNWLPIQILAAQRALK